MFWGGTVWVNKEEGQLGAGNEHADEVGHHHKHVPNNVAIKGPGGHHEEHQHQQGEGQRGGAATLDHLGKGGER